MGKTKSPRGEFAARTLRARRKKLKWNSNKYKRKKLRLGKAADPLEKAPQAKGIVLEKVGLRRTGMRHCYGADLVEFVIERTERGGAAGSADPAAILES